MLRSKKSKTGNRAKAILLVICLFLTGCGKQDAKDAAAQGETTDIFSSYTISPSGVLRNNGRNYLLFYDKKSDSSVYLCNRAGCRHIDNRCGAYYDNLYEAFFYNDQLYIITLNPTGNSQIFRANRYGEDRELLAETSLPVLQQKIVGNEYYFFGPVMEEGDNGSSHSVGQLLCRLNLDTGDYKEFPAIDTGYPNASPGHFAATEDAIYLNYTASSVDVNDFFDFETGELKDITWDEIVQTDLLYRMDRNTGETKLLCTRETTGDLFGISVLEEREDALILYSPDRIWEYDPQTGAETILYAPAGGNAQITQISRLGEYYLVCDYANRRFVLLKDWQEAGSFSGSDQEIDTYFGISGDTVYFGRNGALCMIQYDDFVNGAYDFMVVDL